MVVGKRLRAVLAGTILLIIVVSLAAFLSAPRQTDPAPQVTAPGIEEHHYITVTVKAPDNTTRTHTYETKSFVYIEAFVLRAFSTWALSSSFAFTKMFFISSPSLVEADGSPHGALATYLTDDGLYCLSSSSIVFLGSGISRDGGRTLGNPLNVYAVPSVGYIYNDVWFNVTITATFSFSNATAVSEAGLGVMAGDSVIPPTYITLIYDSFPVVSVPAGSSITIQWVLAWKDYGAFTENWGKLWQYALTLNYGCAGQYINFTDDAGAVVSIPWPNIRNDASMALRLAWGMGTSPMSRSSYRLGQEKGSVRVGYTIYGTGMAIGGAVDSQATEVGLYWLVVDNYNNPRRILLMRWVPGYTLPPGTPVNIYIAKGG